jgi:guanyl-specific ribonuclease Sa
MAKTVGFGKLQREMLSNERLPPDVRVAVIEFKNRIRLRNPLPVVFENREGGLPAAAAGQVYYEYQVGWATAPTAADPNARGSRRLVALVDAGGNILRMYFSGEHYFPGEWCELQYP